MRHLRSLYIVSLIIALLIGACPVGVAAPALARNQDQNVHVVQPGENMFRISLRYGTTVDAIMAANGLTNAHTVYVGQRLVIPGAAGTTPPPGGPTAVGGSYTVRSGDTLTRIALRHGVTLGALMQANGISNPHTIYAGQRLIIPGTGLAEPNPGEGSSIPGGMVPGTDNSYVVQPGDTLSKIAQRFGTTVPALARLNGIVNPSTIFVGQVLRLTGEAPPALPGSGKRIIVSLSEQHLYAYQGEELVYTFVASSGAAPNYTRAGEFRVQSKLPKAYGSAWNIWMPNWLGIYWAGSTENGIHALPILPNGQTLWAGLLGSPVSYGCIVLGTHEAQLLYDWADLGTPVSVRH